MRGSVVLASACAGLLACHGVAAQESPARPSTGDPPRTTARNGEARLLDTVVVTARRREEELREVPLSVTALDGEELESRAAQDITALAGAVPNLTILPARAFTGTLTAYIRGIGQFDPVWGVEPGVGVYVDDVYLARPQGALLDILDVERIEVLRGPQGTLYGKNTIGGAIKFITRPVGAAFSGSVSLTAGSYDQRDIKAMLNVPMGEGFGTRVAFGSFDRDGFGTNLATGQDVSARHVDVARLGAEWSPTDAVDVRFAYDRFRDRSGVRGARRLAVNPFDPQRTPPDPGRYDVRNDAPNIDSVDTEGGSITIDWRMGERWRLKSITAYRHGDSIGTNDFDTLPITISTLLRVFRDSQASQELQLHWSGDEDHAVAGVYLSDGMAGGAGYNNNGNATFIKTEGRIDSRSAAVYGDLTHALNAKWNLEAGLRYTRERKAATVFNRGYADAAFTTPTGRVNAHFSDAATFSALSPRINLSWRPGDTTMLYAQVSRGFKSGSYNIRAQPAVVPESALPLDSETVTAYEAGAKTQWRDGRLALNAAVFHNDYRDIQLSVFTAYDSNRDGVIGAGDQFFGDFRNAGSGTLRGAELEFSMLAGRWLRFIGNAGYLDSRYGHYFSGGRNIAATQHFANAPRWTAGASVVATWPLPSAGTLEARIDGRYQSLVYTTTDLSNPITQPGYSLWNAALAWESPRRRWRVALSAQNLADKAYLTTGFNIPTSGTLTGFYGPPRTVSLSATCAF